MTNEEIQRKAFALATKWMSDRWPEERNALADEVLALANELVAQAYDEVARIVCPMCAEGIHVAPFYVDDETEPASFVHGIAGDLSRCLASDIRALKDKLNI